MAGYLMNLDSLDSLELYAESGVYATKIPLPTNGQWMRHHEATFADYVTMRPGDNIYFFIKREIFGIGELVAAGPDCKYLNHPLAAKPQSFDYATEKSALLWDQGNVSAEQPWICLFKPAPHFFKSGIDMDDMLSSNPRAFRMLPAFWKVSFVKFDTDENQAFRDALLKLNEKALTSPTAGKNTFKAGWQVQHAAVAKKVTGAHHRLDPQSFLSQCAEGERLRHEMAIELGLLSQLAAKEAGTTAVFGEWDYLSHQVVASPFKPIDYMDRMDVFGYAFIAGYEPTKARFLVAELKKDEATGEDIEQLMKYVDWVKDEYCFGDYSMIRAFLVAAEFAKDAVGRRAEIASRRFIVGRRPAVSREWSELVLAKYSFDDATGRLKFSAA